MLLCALEMLFAPGLVIVNQIKVNDFCDGNRMM
jgi:hypothetical protein